MRFLKNKYREFSIQWIARHTIIVIKERRLPQIGLISKLKKLLTGSFNKKEAASFYGIDVERIIGPVSTMEIKIPEAQRQSNLINSYFDCIYLLNLKSRSDKRLRSIFQLVHQGINTKIVDAVNGRMSPFIEQYEKYVEMPLGAKNAHPLEKKYHRKMITSPGGWGVLISKKQIFLDAIKNNYKRILVLQDDMFFIDDFHNRFASFINEIDEDWKIIALGATQHSWTVSSSIYYKDQDIKDYDPDQKFYYPLRTDGAFALGYDHSVFQFIIDEIDKMNCSFDSGAVRSVYKKYRGKCFVCQPNLIIADVSTSDIRSGRNQENFSVKMKWDLKLYDRNKHDELVSVIMPAYNAEKTIADSILSVLKQTYENLELIIVDDGSTDGTEAIVRELAGHDKRIVYKRNDLNRGCYFVRNDALRLSKGKYIAIQDSDDLSLGNRLEKQLIPLVSGNALFTIGKIIRSKRKIEELDYTDETKLFEILDKDREKVKNANSNYFHKKRLGLNSTMFHRDLFKEFGLFWENRFGSDAEILERVIYQRTGFILTKDKNTISSHLISAKKLQGIYKIMNDVLVISPEMNEENLSNRYEMHGDERAAFRKIYRDRLLGKYDYQYPVF